MATNGCVEVLSMDTKCYLAKCTKSAKSRLSKKQPKIVTDLMEIVMTIVVAVSTKYTVTYVNLARSKTRDARYILDLNNLGTEKSAIFESRAE